MMFTTRLILLCLSAASLPAAATADKEIIREAIHSAVATKPREPEPRPAQNEGSKTRDIVDQVMATGTPSSGHRDRGYFAADCASSGNCPFGSPGDLSFDEVRYLYRNYPDSELWNICLGRRTAPYPGGSQGACMILGSPNPLRPVDVPHNLERDETALEQSSPALPHKAELIDAKLEGDGQPPCKANEALARKRPDKECVRTLARPSN
jgi:hypothetical protein